MINFALNQMTAPGLSIEAFLDLASSLGCVGVELRNDLRAKGLTKRNFFDDQSPSSIATIISSRKLRLLGLSEVYGFNRWTDDIQRQTRLLIEQAAASGAESISLIPDNSGQFDPHCGHQRQLISVLSEIRPMLEVAGLVGLIEPLGFATSSLRFKRDAVDAINAVQGEDRFRLVHDTFHHFLAGESQYFPKLTGIVHISGIEDLSLKTTEMADKHRVLVCANDFLGNIAQISALVSAGYGGAFSYESFASEIHQALDRKELLTRSITHIRTALQEST